MLDNVPDPDDEGASPLIASWLAGHYADPEAIPLSEEVDPFNLPSEEAIAFFRRKRVVDRETFDLHEDEYKSAVFTAARASDRYTLDHIHADIQASIEEGGTLGEFLTQADERLDKLGTDGKGDFYWETVFRNNTQSAFATGRWERQQAVKGTRPYLEYVAIMDSVTRPAHAKFNGVIRHMDDPFWASHYPINGHRCRCTTRSHSQSSLDSSGRKVTPDEEIPELNPDPGFKGNPGTQRVASNAAREARRGLVGRGIGATGRDLSRANDPGRVSALQSAFPGGGEAARRLARDHGRVVSPMGPTVIPEGKAVVQLGIPTQSPEVLERQLIRIFQHPRLYPHRDALTLETAVECRVWNKSKWKNPEVALETVGGTTYGYSSLSRLSLPLPPEELDILLELWRDTGLLKSGGLRLPSPLEQRFSFMDAQILGASGKPPLGYGWAYRTLEQVENGWVERLSVAPVTGAERVAVNLGQARTWEIRR